MVLIFTEFDFLSLISKEIFSELNWNDQVSVTKTGKFNLVSFGHGTPLYRNLSRERPCKSWHHLLSAPCFTGGRVLRRLRHVCLHVCSLFIKTIGGWFVLKLTREAFILLCFANPVEHSKMFVHRTIPYHSQLHFNSTFAAYILESAFIC